MSPGRTGGASEHGPARPAIREPIEVVAMDLRRQLAPVANALGMSTRSEVRPPVEESSDALPAVRAFDATSGSPASPHPRVDDDDALHEIRRASGESAIDRRVVHDERERQSSTADEFREVRRVPLQGVRVSRGRSDSQKPGDRARCSDTGPSAPMMCRRSATRSACRGRRRSAAGAFVHVVPIRRGRNPPSAHGAASCASSAL